MFILHSLLLFFDDYRMILYNQSFFFTHVKVFHHFALRYKILKLFCEGLILRSILMPSDGTTSQVDI